MKELQDAFLAELDDQLAKYGFERPARSSYYRKEPCGKSAFHISFIKHRTDCDLTADVAVRIDELEQLVNANNPRIAKSERNKTFSLGAELGNISEGRPKRWTLATLEDMNRIVPSVMSTFREVGLPYIERYASLRNAFEALKPNDRASWLHSPFHGERCRQIVALAFLLGKVEQMDGIIQDCTRFLKDRNDPELAGFLAFAEAIRRRAIG
jgi:hypothetical protein